MKTKTLFSILLCLVIAGTGCEKEDTTPTATTGMVQFKTLNPLVFKQKMGAGYKSAFVNPPLVGDTTETLFTSLNFCIGDVWVSQGEVKAGAVDNLHWIKLTGTTNRDLMLFEDYNFAPVQLPVGTYKSVKITFKNIFYRHVILSSDHSVKYELLETMGSTFDPCDENDTSWVDPNYFSAGGNHSLVSGVFQVQSEGEVIAPFTIEGGRTAIISWRLLAGVTTPCTNYLIDLNHNQQWDCGIDDIKEECPPDVKYMWDFVIEYQ